MSDTFEFDDQNHAERFVGTLHDPGATVGDVLTVQVGGGIAAAPGGGVAVQAIYTGNDVSINDGANSNLTVDALASGTALLDITSPSSPLFLAGGTYAITATLFGEALTAAGHAVGHLGTQSANPLTACYTQSPADAWGVAGVVVASAGDLLFISVSNFDGVSARNFSLATVTVVKLS